jgi:DNA-binding beta-propeller fold protein YncE
VLGRSRVIAIAVAVAALGFAAPLTAGPPKAHLALAQLSGTAGCLADPAGEGNAEGCAKGKALNSATEIALTSDATNAYVTTDNSLVTVARDKSTGELSEPGCISNDTGDGRVGTSGICSDGDALRGGKDVAVSPDGAWVYATALISSSLDVFARDSKGTLRQSACVEEFVVAGHCQDAVGIEGSRGLTVSPDGKSVYVLGGVDPERETSRNAGTIALFKPDGSGGVQQTQCVSDDGSNGACVLSPGLSMPVGADVSPDGKNLYVVGADSLLIFERNTTTGTLTPAGCMLENPPGGGPCSDMPSVFFAHDVAVSPDGRSVYTAGVDGIREFNRKDDG